MTRQASSRADALPALAELFRELGYEGASLTLIGKATGLGKGSLYNFFPGGKEEMLAAVLEQIDTWFEVHVFGPLAQADAADGAVTEMFESVDSYFRSGERVCLVGVLALGDASRDRFAGPVRSYFRRWVDALATALTKSGHDEGASGALAEEVVAGIQGGIVLARALGDPSAFGRTLANLRVRVAAIPDPLEHPQSRSGRRPGKRQIPGGGMSAGDP